MPNNAVELRARIRTLADEASRGCGLSHDFYVERFSSAIEAEYGGADPAVRAAAIAIAREFDYASPEQIEQMHESQDEAGLCRHGLDSMTCPAGCFE